MTVGRASCEGSRPAAGPYTALGGCQRVLQRFLAALCDYHHTGLVGASPWHNELSASTLPPKTPARLPPVRRLVAVGDLHGDYAKSLRAFAAGGLVDARGDWTGGDSVLVQVGDQLDRGPDEIKIFVWLERLKRQAARAGGAVHVINGNHETISVQGKFRYASPGGFSDFNRWFASTEALWRGLRSKAGLPRVPATPPAPENRCAPVAAGRYRALRPGGPLTMRFLARHNVVQGIGSTLFVHGGLLPEHLEQGGLDDLNQRTRDWMVGADDGNGGAPRAPPFIRGRNAVVWSRHFSSGAVDCAYLGQVLKQAGFERMVVGHTIQEDGITSACNGKVWRVDVGLSKGCTDGPPQALEILQDHKASILREPGSTAPLASGFTPAP